MGLMDEAMRADIAASMDTDQFGETITYTRADGTVLTPTVIIDRNAPQRDPEYTRTARVFDVQIAYGVLTTPPAKGDRITVKEDPTDSATVSKEFVGLVTADVGGWLAQFA